jgi:hypothetical protein
VSLWGLATGSGAWQTQLVIPVSGLKRGGSPEGLLCPKWWDRLERRNPGGGGNDREYEFRKGRGSSWLSPLAMIAVGAF